MISNNIIIGQTLTQYGGLAELQRSVDTCDFASNLVCHAADNYEPASNDSALNMLRLCRFAVCSTNLFYDSGEAEFQCLEMSIFKCLRILGEPFTTMVLS